MKHMKKSLNQRIYEIPADVKKAIYDSGKQEGVQELFKDTVRLGACSRGIILEAGDIVELKEKYNIK